ncbi:hypothetical protein Tco_1267511 [Tanacetum coccineum]
METTVTGVGLITLGGLNFLLLNGQFLLSLAHSVAIITPTCKGHWCDRDGSLLDPLAFGLCVTGGSPLKFEVLEAVVTFPSRLSKGRMIVKVLSSNLPGSQYKRSILVSSESLFKDNWQVHGDLIGLLLLPIGWGRAIV